MTTAAQPTNADFIRLPGGWLGHGRFFPRLAGAENPGGGAPAGVGGGQGEGGEDQGGGGDELYQPYLSNVPAELHPMVLEPLRAQSADFTRRFQEASQFRQQMEPYSQIEGFNDVPPEEMTELLQFQQILRSGLQQGATPEQRQPLVETVQALSQALGISPEVDEDTWAQMGEQNGWLESDGTPTGGDESGLLDQVKALLDERLGPIQESQAQMDQRAQQEQQQREHQERTQQFESRYSELAQQHGIPTGGEDPESQEKAAQVQNDIVALAHSHLNDEDPLGKAFEQYLRMTGGAQGDLIENKLGTQPGIALNGGNPSTSPEQPSWHGGGPSPKDLALARMRQ